MKVRDGVGGSANISEVTSKDEKKSMETKNVSFQNQLKKVETENQEERVKILVDDIFKQGDKLSKNMDIRELKKYKIMISEFLEETLSNSQKFSKDSFLDRRGRHRVFATVKKLNQELDDLTKDVLEKEKDHIKILGRIGDIRGLIMDIVL